VSRLLAPELAPILSALARMLDTHTRRGKGPALVWVLPSALAGRFRAALGSHATFRVFARLPTAEWGDDQDKLAVIEKEYRDWSRKVAPLVPEGTWRNRLRDGGSDLRVLHEWATQWRRTQDPAAPANQAVLLRWAQHDLRGLTPSELLALVLLCETSTQVLLKDVRPGMAVDEEFKSTVRSSSSSVPKVLASLGQVLDGVTIDRIRSDPRPPHEMRIRGYSAKGTPIYSVRLQSLSSLARLTTESLRPLAKAGVAFYRAGVFHALPLYERAVAVAFESQAEPVAAFRLLSSEAYDLAEGIPVGRLSGAKPDEVRLLLGVEAEGRLPTVKLMGRVWDRERKTPPSPQDALALAKALLEDAHVIALSAQPEEAGGDSHQKVVEALRISLPTPRFAVVAVSQGGHRRPNYYLALGNDGAAAPLTPLKRALSQIKKEERPISVLVGPGLETTLCSDPSASLVVMREIDVRQILTALEPREAFLGVIRAHLGLAVLSPFNAVGALLPGSPMFVGRRAIREEVRRNLTKRNFLIVGSRQIGKTSLLNQIRYEAASREDVWAVAIDTQGVRNLEQVRNRLFQVLPDEVAARLASEPSARALMQSIAREADTTGRTAVFFINEIDGLLAGNTDFVEHLRGLSDLHGARFVLVGYADAYRQLNNPNSPFFHMTSGHGGDKAFNLAELSEEEALELVDKLEEAPLHLRWASKADRDAGRALIVAQSYCIPWVIQNKCAGLVRALDQKRRAVLQLDDVRKLGAHGQGLLQHLEKTPYEELLGQTGATWLRHAARFALVALARSRYFTDTAAPIGNPHLKQIDPSQFSFTPSQALDVVNAALRSDLLPDEAERVRRFFAGFDMEALLRSLCLTLIIAPVPHSDPPAYCFQNHIYPIELHRVGTSGRTLADREIDALTTLLQTLPKEL
jgi:hypothetical protein